jgi:hypothetical protein
MEAEAMTKEDLMKFGWRSIETFDLADGASVEGFHWMNATHRHTVGYCYRVDGVWHTALDGKRLPCQPNFWRPIDADLKHKYSTKRAA